MIFVTIGTSEPFDRLLRALPRAGDEELVVQAGESSLQLDNARHLPYVSFERLVELVRAARVVVTHAGVGTIMVALANGKRPVVMPRLARFGEAVDDHQLGLARRLADAGIVTLAEDEVGLAAALVQPSDAVRSSGTGNGKGALAAELHAFIADKLGTPLTQSSP